MITRIELDGFKTFRDFKLEFAPFQVIVGPNGAGKSNLFDALRLLSRLADSDLRSAFQDLRGEAGELFTTLPDGRSMDRMRLTAEILVERRVQDSWGTQADLKYTRLRYELEIVRRTDEHGLDRLYVNKEQLLPIRRGSDAWLKRYELSEKNWMPKLRGGRVPFISMEPEESTATIQLHQDGHGGRKASVAERMERTVLSGVINAGFPHAFAAREEMRSWKFLHLNPEVLRQPSSMLAQPFIAPDGSNLPTALARMKAEDSFILSDISRDLANLVPGILDVEVEADRVHDQYLIHAETQDGRSFSSRVLSDGTRRALALVALQDYPQQRGVLCFEEPENGVHPFRLKNLVDVLSELATDFSDPEQTNEPLRQLLVNTHSPVLVGQPMVWPNLFFAYMVTHISSDPASPPQRITRIVPVQPTPQLKMDLGINAQVEKYTVGQVIEYLNTTDFGEIPPGTKAENRP